MFHVISKLHKLVNVSANVSDEMKLKKTQATPIEEWLF
jgi:hypothetical protein